MRGKVCLRCNTCIFLVAQKMCRKLSWKRYLQIAFCLVSSDSNCIAVSEGGKIQNTKKAYDSMQHIFWAMEIIPIFFWEYQTFNWNKIFPPITLLFHKKLWMFWKILENKNSETPTKNLLVARLAQSNSEKLVLRIHTAQRFVHPHHHGKPNILY